MKKLSLSDDLPIKRNKSNSISKSFNIDALHGRQQSLSLRKSSPDKQGTMHIVEMWSQKMKKQCDKMIEDMRQKQQMTPSSKRTNNVPPIMLKEMDLMKSSNKTTLPRSRITSFNLREPVSKFMKKSLSQKSNQGETLLNSVYSVSHSGRSIGVQLTMRKHAKLSPITQLQSCLNQCDTLISDVQSISKKFSQPKPSRFNLYFERRQMEKLKEMFLLSKQY